MVALVVLWVGCGGQGQPSSAKPESATESSPARLQQPAGLLQDQPASPSSAQPESAKPLPPEIIQAWQEAGATVGWMATIWDLLRFASTKEEILRDMPDFLKSQVVFVPAFRLARWQEGQIATLPSPPLPFGLDLSLSEITDAGLKELAGLKNLQRLDLSGTQITDAGLKELAGLKNLQALVLWETRITDAGLKELQQALPHCKIVK